MNRNQSPPDRNEQIERFFFTVPPFTTIPKNEQVFIREKCRELQLSHQHIRMLIEYAADLHQWEEPSISRLWDESGLDRCSGKERARRIIERIGNSVKKIRETPFTYDRFAGNGRVPGPCTTGERQDFSGSILGTCPVAGERTRCCSLLTLDAVEQCGYGCSYCSIQSFYEAQTIYFHPDLERRLAEIELDPDTVYHIGTGQSSDSLMWGNRNGMLEALFAFARKYPNVLLELKTKSANIGWIDTLDLPPNVIASWSLNAPTIIRHEEHGTADLEARLAAARQLADHGVLVGFHFHPIVRFAGWEDEYAAAVDKVRRMFSPDETVMISLGTLTFIKPVLKKLRASGISSKVLQMPLIDAAGKLSYPEEIKINLFSHVYRAFGPEWHAGVFFYLCMEPDSLWEPVFGYRYPDNASFEKRMKMSYMTKVLLARDLKRKYNSCDDVRPYI